VPGVARTTKRGHAGRGFRRLALALTLAALAADVASAAEVGGVKLDDRVSVGGRQLALNGAGVRAKLLVKIYVVSLYLPQPAKDPREVFARTPRRIQMNMLLDAPSEEIAKAILDTMADNNSAAQLAAVKAQTDQLVSLIRRFKAVKNKDVITLDFVNGETRLGWNGRARGSIAGEAFNQALTKIWLGEKPVQADLKQALLGG
jgi:long-chain acyl-CoA synthetase